MSSGMWCHISEYVRAVIMKPIYMSGYTWPSQALKGHRFQSDEYIRAALVHWLQQEPWSSLQRVSICWCPEQSLNGFYLNSRHCFKQCVTASPEGFEFHSIIHYRHYFNAESFHLNHENNLNYGDLGIALIISQEKL